jgi:hypothetical protein
VDAGPRRNRVTPTGEIVAIPLRGAWCGNRGNLHGRGTTVLRFHGGRLWIVCALAHKDQLLVQWSPGRYTLLFFHDEAVAFAAGHRPCAECRHRAFTEFADAWAAAHGGGRPYVPEMDAVLHAERRRDRDGRRILTAMPWADLPDGVFVMDGEDPAVVAGDQLTRYDPVGNAYGEHRPRPQSGTAVVITPPSTVAVLRAGYPVQIADEAR